MRTHEPDDLSRLLRQWPASEPRPAFAQDVLRRIRLEAAAPRARGRWAWFPGWFGFSGRLAWVAGLPLVLALLAGVASARVQAPPSPGVAAPFARFSVVDRGTLTGAYLAMAGSAVR